MDAVVVDIKGGVIFIEKPPDVERYAADFARLGTDLAMDASRTKDLIRQEMERR